MRIARETRKFAWNALGKGQYWPLVGSRCIMTLLAGAVWLFAIFVGVALAVVFCLFFFGSKCDFLNPGSLPGMMENAMERFGPATFMLCLFIAGMVVANVAILPLLYAWGFFRWGVVFQDMAVLRGEARFEQVFSGWGRGWRMAWIAVVRQTYALLWTLLFVVPGIVKSFSYAMTDFVAVEHPDWTANRCIAESCRLMEGNRWRYFCLCLSFIGWWLLVALVSMCHVPFSECFLQPYVEIAQMAFYGELKELRPQTDFT